MGGTEQWGLTSTVLTVVQALVTEAIRASASAFLNLLFTLIFNRLAPGLRSCAIDGALRLLDRLSELGICPSLCRHLLRLVALSGHVQQGCPHQSERHDNRGPQPTHG